MSLPTAVPTADRILRMTDLEELVGLRRTQLQEMVKEGRFPAPVRLSSRAVGWRGRDVLAWIDSRPPVVPSSGEA